MTTVLTLDRAGRVLVPRTLRKQLHLSPGRALQPDSKEHGVWVYLGEATDISVLT